VANRETNTDLSRCGRFLGAECPIQPDCLSQVCTREEAIQNIREATNLYIEVLEEDRLPVRHPKYEFEVVA